MAYGHRRRSRARSAQAAKPRT